jgi:hypothetical protein
MAVVALKAGHARGAITSFMRRPLTLSEGSLLRSTPRAISQAVAACFRSICTQSVINSEINKNEQATNRASVPGRFLLGSFR